MQKFSLNACAKVNNSEIQLIETAAMIMQQERVDEPFDALKRAAKRLGNQPARWPSAELVRKALAARLALFAPQSAAHLRAARIAALEALPFFSAFNARVVGGLVDASFTQGGVIQIECMCETPERLAERLAELKIPATQREKPSNGESGSHSAFKSLPRTFFEFKAGAYGFQLRVLTPGAHGYSSEMRADVVKLRSLIETTPPV